MLYQWLVLTKFLYILYRVSKNVRKCYSNLLDTFEGHTAFIDCMLTFRAVGWVGAIALAFWKWPHPKVKWNVNEHVYSMTNEGLTWWCPSWSLPSRPRASRGSASCSSPGCRPSCRPAGRRSCTRSKPSPGAASTARRGTVGSLRV